MYVCYISLLRCKLRMTIGVLIYPNYFYFIIRLSIFICYILAFYLTFTMTKEIKKVNVIYKMFFIKMFSLCCFNVSMFFYYQSSSLKSSSSYDPSESSLCIASNCNKQNLKFKTMILVLKTYT